MTEKELMGYKHEEILKTLEPPVNLIIKKGLEDLCSSIEKKEGFSDLSIFIGMWSYLNLLLRTISIKSPTSDLQKLMDDINTYNSKLLKDPEFIENV